MSNSAFENNETRLVDKCSTQPDQMAIHNSWFVLYSGMVMLSDLGTLSPLCSDTYSGSVQW